ncbi:MAG: ABC transporter ATP-binding protein [Eubacteriales bacterium]|nr:ABC transporter ATP-binding protein [Eubacteriales bacterium]MDD4327329.1 ABC transporter ATP-binding protein [Eubacteriales bacterium]MDD4717016.1 ABC transporter ATP-binding protein [Eubacteriales bacterium]NCU25557.1 ABC transporter ATP-binding protein [Candidatus Nomurabacteria bacterium]
MTGYEKLLEVREIHKVYGDGQISTKALNSITFDVLRGEFLGIMGASGSGKTTLLNCIATMIRPTSGSISLNGRNITSFKGTDLARYRGKKIGYLFQEFELLDNLTAGENISLPLSIHGESAAIRKERLKKLTRQLDIEDILDKFPSQLSGGQKQRVAAARALICSPDIVLADEPTGALDTKNSKVLMEKLSSINQDDGASILMVTHDANAASFCSRILFLQDGAIFNELRKMSPEEDRSSFYERILSVMALLGGGSANVL